MADDFNINGLDELFSQLDKLTIPDEVKKEAIDAAADVYGEVLIQNTRDAVVTPSPNKKTHVWEDVSYKKDQYPDGSVDVGFSKYGYYYRFINNGTKSMKGGGKHFVEHSYDQTQEKMKEIMAETIQKGMKL